MKKISRRALSLYLLILLFLAGCGLLCFNLFTNADSWAMNRANRHLYYGGSLATAGDIMDADGKVLVTTNDGKRVYSDNRNLRMGTLHTLGDSDGYIASGIQTAFKDELTGYNILDGVYNLKRYGKGNDITVTLNSAVCETAFRALGKNKGVVGVMNYKTGDIICIVSAPTYDVRNKPADIETDATGKYDGIYMNRFFSGLYTPGSTFKIITAACAIDNIPDIYSRTFDCKGKVPIGEGEVICSGVHGRQTFEEALNHSCNCAFAEIADELGAAKLTEVCERLGFNTRNITVNGKIKAVKSRINLLESTRLDIGWAGIGQYTTLINPCQMLTAVAAAANGGTAPAPNLIKEISTPEGKITYKSAPTSDGEYFSPETAEKLGKLLRSNVQNQYGDWRFPGLSMCGKTGTAEVSDNPSAKPNALFVGYSLEPKTPFAIIVVVEDTTSSLSSAVPIASQVMKTVRTEYVSKASATDR